MTSQRVTQLLFASAVGLFITGCWVDRPVSPTATASASGSPTAASSATKPAASTATPKRSSEGGSLTLTWPGGTRDFTREQLWTHPKAIDLTLTDQAAHSGKTIVYHAIPMRDLFAEIKVQEGETLEFDTTDGFSASLDPAQVLNRDPAGATAYLAIEDPQQPWPKLRDGKSTAGPLYLVWKDAEKSGIGQEQWPYQLRSFSLKASLESRFPALLPEPKVTKKDPVYRGYQAFLKNCFSCHTLNGEGTSRMGPDLNLPHSPTEYLREEYFRKLVRDPQSLRAWKGSRMSSFSLEMLPESELDDLIAYLRHKAEHRGEQPNS